jgi:sarcosine oxidase subunit alpha
LKKTDIAVIGGGPAGLFGAITAAKSGARVTLIDDGSGLGGELVKQTHKFFGSAKQFAGMRGIDIAKRLKEQIGGYENVELICSATVTGFYEDGVLTIVKDRRLSTLKPERIIVATGASEAMIPFRNNDLPGVYGAGATQTLMNLYGVKPGNRVLMVGAGNIGLIIGYQLLQSGIDVEAVIEAQPQVTGYSVHASKMRRAGVPIYTSHTLKAVEGKDCVEKAVVCQLDDHGVWIPWTEREFMIDTICLAVGLVPLSDLLWQAGCEMKYIDELGGYVALRDSAMRTSVPDIYIAGDVAGIEEATTAMVEGKLAGLNAAVSLDFPCNGYDEVKTSLINELKSLRSGPLNERVRVGVKRATICPTTK